MVFKQKSPISLSLFLCSLSSSVHKIVLWATIELTKLSKKMTTLLIHDQCTRCAKCPVLVAKLIVVAIGRGLVLLWDTITQKYIHKIVTR